MQVIQSPIAACFRLSFYVNGSVRACLEKEVVENDNCSYFDASIRISSFISHFKFVKLRANRKFPPNRTQISYQCPPLNSECISIGLITHTSDALYEEISLF